MRISVRPARVFAYIIACLGPGYRLDGCVPWVIDGTVFFGPCKVKLRPLVDPQIYDDYIMGISPSGVGDQRRILLWMPVAEKMTFAEAYSRGETSPLFYAARGHAIHVRPKEGAEMGPDGRPVYEHIPGAPHRRRWRKDIQGDRDAFLVGGSDSWVAESDGPPVTQELVDLLRTGITWKGEASVRNPLTQNARGKFALVEGDAARSVLSLISRPDRTVFNSFPQDGCGAKCCRPAQNQANCA